MNWKLVEQATRASAYCNRISIAIPINTGVSSQRIVLNTLGIGLLTCGDLRYGLSGYPVREEIHGRFNRDNHFIKRYMYPHLVEEAKDYGIAGSQSARRYTPFKTTVRLLTEYITDNNGALVGDAVKYMDHHYANDKSAKYSLVKYIRTGVIPGLEIRTEKNKLRCYLLNGDQTDNE
ncbi:MAG: hypothetical protein KAS04_04045 [Candidatus Aenigmarchaeota archaeon]|nr:hypothetical protein [Candidatus Aenigmarchaeota archaeon]